MQKEIRIILLSSISLSISKMALFRIEARCKPCIQYYSLELLVFPSSYLSHCASLNSLLLFLLKSSDFPDQQAYSGPFENTSF